jgi:integrase
MKSKITFSQQADKFLADSQSRKRNPIRPASVRTYNTTIVNLKKLIGNLYLQDVGNKVVSEVVQKLSDQGYSARTIALNVVVIKKIRKSALTPNGDQLFPYEWNTEVIDAPSVSNDNKAVVSVQSLQDALSKATPERKALYALLAGTGLRINEARALIVARVDDSVSSSYLPTESKLVIRQQMTRNGLAPVKTEAGVREVDLSADLNSALNAFINITKDGAQPLGCGELIFSDCENCYRDSLEKDGIVGGFHTLRRFRITHLRLAGVPDPLVKFWAGHAAGNVTEQYTQVQGAIQSRKEWVEKAGLGFKL